MKSCDILKTTGMCIFWTFFVAKIVINLFYEDDMFNLLFLCFEFFGISIQIASWRIAKKEIKENEEGEENNEI